MKFEAKHIMIDMTNLHPHKISSPAGLKDLILTLIDAKGLTYISHLEHEYQPHGYSLLVILAESHLSLHTWPEQNSCMLDVVTCGNAKPMPFIMEFIQHMTLDQGNSRILIVNRGEVPQLEEL